MKSIRRELSNRLLLSLSLLSVALAMVLFGSLRAVLVQEFDKSLLAGAKALASLVMIEATGTPEFEYGEGTPPPINPANAPDYFHILLPDGEPFVRSPSLGAAGLPRCEPYKRLPAFRNWMLPNGKPGRLVTIRFSPVLDPDDFPKDNPPDVSDLWQGEMELTLAHSRASLDRTLRGLLVAALVLGLTFPLVVVLVVRVIVKQGLRPLDGLAATAAGIDVHHLGSRFPEEGLPAELAPITAKLNDLLKRLDTAFTRERRLGNDIAHELRTPIAELRSLAEVALMCPEDEALRRQTLEDVVDISRQMESMVEKLLAIARTQRGVGAIEKGNVNWSEMIRETWQSQTRTAETGSLECSLKAGESVCVRADKALLQLITSNILGNAVAHCPANGEIRVSVSTLEGERARLDVRNTNPGLEAKHLRSLKEPFWQGDPSRSDSGRCGLGLTLVAACCDLLGADLDFSLSDDGQWFIVQMVLGLNGVAPSPDEKC